MVLGDTLYLAMVKVLDGAPEGYLNRHAVSHLASVYAGKTMRNENVYYADVHAHLDGVMTTAGFQPQAIDEVAGLIFDTYTSNRIGTKVAA